MAAGLRAETSHGEAWRCLRCGDFVVGGPRRSGPADEAPIVLRGRALRDATILRVLALERGLRGLVLFAVVYGIGRFRTEHQALQRFLDEDLPLFRPLGTRFHFDVDSNAIVRALREVLTVKGSTLFVVAFLVGLYAVIQLVEAVGLWLLKRWGEYLTVVATAAFVPLEVYELSHHVTVTRAAALVVNIAAVAYLVASKRLFGVRGGRPAHEEERRTASLLEVEEASGSEGAG